MRLVRTLFVAGIGLTGLSACVGSDPQARLRAGSGASATALAAEPIEPAQRLTAVMPGDLLLGPQRGGGGITPQAVLLRSETRVAHAAAAAPRRVVARAAPSADAPAPFLAARLGPADAPAPPPALRPALTPLATVEAHAEVEQRAQANRDRRFDAQVRRASGIVCSGCVPATGRRSARAAPAAGETDD